MHSVRSVASRSESFHAPGMQAGAWLQRRCACGSHAGCSHAGGGRCGACGKAAAGALVIGAANDPLESEADRIAGQALAGPAAAPATAGPVRVQRAAQGGSGAGTAPASVARVLAGGSQALAAPVRHDMQQRFGHDFSGVAVHTGPEAEASARDVGAEAYTVGRHIVFGAGQFAPATGAGRQLLAHELAHVLQQGAGVVRRKLRANKPKDMIDHPTGKGVKQTNAATVKDYLQTLCADGGVNVDKGTGNVTMSRDFCPVPLAPGEYGPRVPSKADKSKTATGCGCVCDMVASVQDFQICVNDNDWPHTSGLVVTTPSPNSTKLWGAGTASGKATVVDPWLVLGHELCGHAWLSDQGLPDTNDTRGEGGHQETVARENLIRAEHGIEARGDFKAPFCGESFFQDKAGPGPVQWSSYEQKCMAWRKKTYGNKYQISDQIP